MKFATTYRLDWNQIFQVGPEIESRPYVIIDRPNIIAKMEDSLKAQYYIVFEGPVGLMKGVSTDIVVDEDATPIFCKARPVA